MTKEQQAALDLLYNTYSPLGYDMASIAGIAGNGLVESGLNPDSVSASKTYHGAWLNHKNIRKAIESMYNDYSMQSLMKFIDDWNNRADNVMKGNYSAYTSTNAGKYKKSGYKTARDAADAFMRYYERPVIMKDGKVVGYQKANERYANAEAAYKYLYDKYGSPEITEYNLPDGGKRMIFKPRQVDVQLSDAVAVQKPTVITPIKRALPIAEVQKTLPETVTTGRRIQPLASQFSAELPSLDDVFDLGGPEDLFKQYVADVLGVPNMHLKMPSFKKGKPGEEVTDNTTVYRPQVMVPIKRQFGKVVDPKVVERLLQQQPVIKQGKSYTQRRVDEENSKRTWRSDAADISHAVGEGALLAANFIPFEGELALGFNWAVNNAKSYLTHPFYKTVYHGSPYPFDIKNAWTATQYDMGVHVTPNIKTSINAAKFSSNAGNGGNGFVYKLRIPKEDSQTIDIGRNGVGHLYTDFFVDSKVNTNPPGFEPNAYYDTTPGDVYRINMLKEAGANPTLTDATHLQTLNPVWLNLRKLFPRLNSSQLRLADLLVNKHKELMEELGYVPGRNEMYRQLNQLANDLLSSAGHKVIKYHNANPYEGGGGTAYMITDPSVMDVMLDMPKLSPLGWPTANIGAYLYNR